MKTVVDKHTSGPWSVTDDAGHFCIRPGTSGFLLASVPHVTRDNPGWGDKDPVHHAEANANLIAAAPDLLEALKGLRALILGEHGISAYECVDGERADAAIAKAEGR